MMQFSRFVLVFLTVSSVLNLGALEKPAAPQEPAKAEALSDNSAKPAGPAVDDAKVNGSTFESPYFKFTFELPTGWKTLDDASRKASNQQAMREDMEHAKTVAVPKKTAAKTPAMAPAETNPKPQPQANPVVPERYSLLAASPDGLSSLGSPALPRINIWAHRKVPPLDKPVDHAQLLMTGKRTQVLVSPQELTINGRKFVRVELVNPAGKYQARYITEIGDYLVGFDFLTDSERELAEYSNSIKSANFQ
jgi:hypothetical protein